MIFDCLQHAKTLAAFVQAFLQSHIEHTANAYLLPRMAFDLWKLEFGVIGIHLADLLAGRCAEHFDDLHQLVDARVTREYRLAEQQFGEYAAGAPHIWDGCVCGNGIR